MRLLSNLLSGSRSKTPEQHAKSRKGNLRRSDSSIDASARTHLIDAAGSDVAACRYTDALARIDEALAAAPKDAHLVFARASTLFRWGRYCEALADHQRASILGLDSGALHTQWGWALCWVGRQEEALASMRKAVVAQPDDWATHFGLAAMLRANKLLDESLAASMRALQLKPDDFHCTAGLIACEVELRRLDDAEKHARRAVELDPQRSLAWSNLGGVLDHQCKFDDALAAYARAEQIEAASPESPDEYVNCVICLLRAARTHDALAMLERNLPRYTDAQAQSHYALALLTCGRITEGWDQYEFRWMKEPLSLWRANFVKPVWTGQDLYGRTILLRTEQGHGDFIQFIRYAKHIKALGAKVLLQLREEVRGLADLLPEIDEILRANEPYPPFDFYVNLMSIPRAFGTDLSSIPAEVPYLQADPARIEEWARWFPPDGMLKVGLVWAGSPTHPRDRFRSLALARLAPLMNIDGVRFYSLQKGPAAAEAVSPPVGTSIVDLGPELRDFGDTAAVIGHLDLVLAVDTSVVHLAGALGKPVWVLLPKPADWRWLEERDDTPWYPSMRLFRQREIDDWDEVLHRAETALRQWTSDASRRRRVADPPLAVPSRPLRPAVRNVCRAVKGLSEVVETRVGIMQYFADQPLIGTSLRWYGEYLQRQVELLARLGIAGKTVLEAGAGVGFHTLFLASKVGAGGHLFIYENDDLLKRALRQNLASNRVTNATLMRRSLGRTSLTESSIGQPFTHDDSAQSFPLSSEVETIDELHLKQLHWLKINESVDASAVLAGASDSLWRLRPTLFIGALDVAALQRLAAKARDFGYSCWRNETPLFNPGNFNLRDADIFGGKTSIALLAIPEESSDLPSDEFERLA